MKKIIIALVSIAAAWSVLTAAPVKNQGAANCIKRFFETHGTYNFGKNRITNAVVGCKDGVPTVTFWNSVKRQKSGAFAWYGSFGAKVRKACPVNPCN
jgi:hypothetical protein